MKTKLFFIITLLLVFFVPQLFSEEVPVQKARKVALNFYFEKASQISDIKYQDLSISDEYIIKKGNKSLYYVFNINNEGFIIVSGEDAVYPVLGYSFSGTSSKTGNPPSYTYLMKAYEDQVIYARTHNLTASNADMLEWQKYCSPDFLANNISSNFTTVLPLITSIWSQGCNFNDSCPADPSGPCGNVVTGCVATSFGQMLHYHKHPPQGVSSNSYIHPNYGTLSVNFGNTFYNFNSMPDTLNSPDSDVAQLLFHCGVAVEMNYSPSSSGAGYARDAIVNYFNYSSTAQLLNRSIFSDTIWQVMLKYELDNNRPLIYYGYGSGGHAFLCDGYQSGNYFHFNWGWGGSQNGYFYLSNLNPGGSNFSNNNAAIFGITPSIGACTGLTTLFGATGNFDDGSGAGNYSNNSNCKWLITPPGATSIALTFDSLDLLPGDTIKIYDGPNTSSPMLGSFSGSVIPPLVISTDSTMLLHFITDGTNVSSGWTVDYTATLPGQYCSGLTILTAATDTIVDGSGPNNYNDHSDCRWLIQPPGATSITLTFTSFDTETAYDFVHVYDGNSTSAPLLGSFSGNTLPPVLSSTGGSMFVHFESDGGVVAAGWECNYQLCQSPPSIIAYPSPNICFGDTITLITQNFYNSYQWNLFGNPISGATTSTIQIANPGMYSVNIVNNCNNNHQSAPIIVNFATPVANAGPDTGACIGTCIMLVGTGGVSYNWSTGNFTDSIIVCPFIPTTYYLTITDTNGCTAIDSVFVATFLLPVVSLSGYDPIYCPSGQPDPLVGNPAGGVYSGTGMVGNTFDPVLAGVGSHSITYTYTDPHGCYNSDYATLLVDSGPPATVTLSGVPTFCEGDSVSIYVPVSSGLSYQWLINGITMPGGNNFFITVSQNGNYSVIVTDSTGCHATSLPVLVTVYPNPVVDLGPDTIICFYDTVMLDAGPGFDNYLWTDFSKNRFLFATSDINNTGPKNISVIVTKDGCTGFDTVTVTFDPCTGISEHNNDLYISLYPNPSNGNFTINFEDSYKGNLPVRVYNVYGQLVESIQLHKSSYLFSTEINLSKLSKGFYILAIEFEKQTIVKPFVVR